MGLKLSFIFKFIFIFTLIENTISTGTEPQEVSKPTAPLPEGFERLDYPYPNYIVGLYPVPPFDAACSCDDKYEIQMCGPSYGDGCEIVFYGRPNCTTETTCLNGCYCDNRRGWYRHPMTLKCVKKHECPVPEKHYIYWNCGGKNEEYRLGDSLCEDSCDFHLGKVKCVANECVAGCYCKKGFARSKKFNNECVPIYDCDYNELDQNTYIRISRDTTNNNDVQHVQFYETEPEPEYFTPETLPECGLNEYFDFCGSTCFETCKTFRYNSTDECKLECEEGCFCKPGFSRHPATGSCVLSSCCPEKDPKVYLPCINTVKYCGGKYEVYREDPLVCSNDVLYKGCFCQNGFKRNYDGVCVPESECYDKDYSSRYIFQDKYLEQVKLN
uniref:CSON014544 protein n=1 Tax=Culicoides sonorensis TaxID=179676 RepID=A0A336LSN9_CULSO